MVAPAGGHQMAHPDGELATARGAGAAETLMVLATGSHYSMEDVAQAASGPLWFQLYHRNHEITEMLVKRAEQAGYKAIALTVDTPINSPIERSIRHGSERPRGFNPANLWEKRPIGFGGRYPGGPLLPGAANHSSDLG